ncbi:MAG: amino acid ABC transporter permease [Chloroflexi bacterium]|nr:amino acid ABC transporter permease [Chloroflexota bacterium]
MTNQLAFLLDNLLNLLFGFPGRRPGGLMMSILLAAIAISLGFVIAILIGTVYDSEKRPLHWATYLYVQIFRGLPLILLVLLVHSVLGYGRRLGLPITPFISALVALTLYSSAYQAEIVRAGLRAVPPYLTESAQLLGSSPNQIYRLIKLPYTWRTMLPAFTGQAISLFKDTSVVIIIGVADLMTTARIALGSDVGNAPFWVGLYLLVGFFYFIVAFGLSRWAHRRERLSQMGDLVHSLANY